MMFPGLDIFKSKQDKETIPVTPLQVQRAKQIESLQVYNQHVIEINRDIKYRVGFTAASQNFTLLVILPPLFPQEKPIISIWPPVRHPWVHKQNLEITECTGLNNFNANSEIGHVVRSIVDEFQCRPPVLISSNRGSIGSTAIASPKLTRTRSSSQGSEKVINGSHENKDANTYSSRNSITMFSSSHPSLTDTSHRHLALSALSINELEDLNSDNQKLKKFINLLPTYKHLKEIQETLLEQNKNLANENLEKEPGLKELKNSLIQKFEIANDLQSKFEESLEKHKILSERFTPPSIRDALHSAAVQSEDQSESVAELFFDGEISVENFIRDYMRLKIKTYHQKAREEKLTSQLNELNKSWY